MKVRLRIGWMLLAAFGLGSGTAQPAVYLNEILFHPPGATDSPNEYIELWGTPNFTLPAGTWFVAVEGDANGNPGTIQNYFDLSGKTIGGNGFLVLLQKTNSYSPNPNATVLVNTGAGYGWGSGSSSSIGHRGEGGQTDLENASATFFLIQTTNAPSIGTDIDSDNNGVPDGAVYGSWTILDSVGVLDNTGPGDIVYGAINFRRNSGATASGTVVAIGFTPGYVGRSGNTTGSAAADWAASASLGGAAPNWTLDLDTDTYPTALSAAALNHIGGPNFGAPAIPGVLLVQSGGSTEVSESGATDSYTLALNTPPAGSVLIQITAGAQLQISTDGGSTFGASRTVSLNDTAPRTVVVRAMDDNVVDTSPHTVLITHAVTSTGDVVNYPLNTLIPTLKVGITDNDSLLLNEVKVNPPGTDDPYEFVEIKGMPGARLTNVYLLAIGGNPANDPGTAELVINLTGITLDSSGLLLVAGDGHPYPTPPGTSVLLAPQLSRSGGALNNRTISILLVSSSTPIIEGDDLDAGDNGTLEGLPVGTTILDAVGWSDGDAGDRVYGGVALTQMSGTPDAAARFPGNTTPRAATAWFCGDLAGSNGDSLVFDPGNTSTNFPVGTVLTPGSANNTAPVIDPLPAWSGVIGDPTNPTLTFTVNDAETPAAALIVTAVSTNQSVVPDANLIITPGPGGWRTLTINPIGVGYSAITVSVSDGTMIGQATIPYAASAMGRAEGRFHTGASDGSAAIAIDANLVLVGDDENQILRLYHRHQSGLPVSTFDMNPFLGLTDLYDTGLPKEIDIEAATRVGHRLFWLGSHSHSGLAESRTNRGRLFATDFSGSGTNSSLNFVGYYNYLKVDLINWDKNNVHGKGANYYGLEASGAVGVNPKAPDGSGFNFEGLSMAPGSTDIAYIAFRAPLVPATNRAKALIVPVQNFAALAASASGGSPDSALFGAPIELNLGCRGIRSIEGTGTNYLVVAGPPGAATGMPPADFRLFTWSGTAAGAPQERAADLSGLNPEAIVELPP
ncbi:MAG TPA: hypothetical protein VGK40_00230, partial [Verrucomicrobiae bacterium]